MKKHLFTPYDGNLGGRTAIKKQIVNHHSALVNAKPTINTREPPRAHVDAHKNFQQKEIDKARKNYDIKENFFTLKKVVTLKSGYTDSKKPKSFGILKKSGPKQSKGLNYINQEHEMHLKAQKKRISQIGQLPHERKKNEFDPISHPSIIFSKPKPTKKSVDDDEGMFYRGNPAKRVATTVSLKKLQEKMQKRPQTANEYFGVKSTDSFSPQKTGTSLNKIIQQQESSQPYQIPRFYSDDPDELEQVKDKLYDIIVDNQLYKKKDMDLLFQNVKNKNPHINEDVIKKVIDDIDDDLND